MKAGRRENVDENRVADRFKASAATYEHTAIVQKEISRQLVAIVDRFGVAGWRRVLEIGCCTGVLTEYPGRRERIDQLFVNDLVPEFCSYTEKAGCSLCRLGESHSAISSRPCCRSTQSRGAPGIPIFGSGTMTEIAALTGRGLQYHANEALTAMIERYFRLNTIHTERKCSISLRSRGITPYSGDRGGECDGRKLDAQRAQRV